MTNSAESARDRILDAAGRILVRDGGTAVTIAAVAREAGVSKGGLFYHFASKELLIEGLVDRYVASFAALIASAGAERGGATRAYLDSAEHPASAADQPVLALLAAAIVSPSALTVLRERYEQWQARLDADGLEPHIAATVRFAVDGIWLADALDLAAPVGETRRRIIQSLRESIE